MASLGALANNPILNFILSLVGNAQQQQTQQEYEGATDQQIADALRVASRIGPEGMATYDADNQRGLQELFSLRGRQGQGYYDRYAAADPLALVPPAGRAVLLHSDADDLVPISQSETYAAASGATLVRVAGDHFAHLDPTSEAVEQLRVALAGI